MAIGDKILRGVDKRRVRVTGGSIRLGPRSARAVSVSMRKPEGAAETWFDANGRIVVNPTPSSNAMEITLSAENQARLPAWDEAEQGDTMNLTVERASTIALTSGTTARTRCRVFDDEDAWAVDFNDDLIAIDSIADNASSGSDITLNASAAAGANYPIHIAYTPIIPVTLISFEGTRRDFMDSFDWTIRFATTAPLDFVT